MDRLANKVAIVTGAARGLGASIAEVFSEEGARVLVTDIRDELGSQLARRLDPTGRRVRYARLDVRAESDWRAAVEGCVDSVGQPNILVTAGAWHRA